MIDIDHPSHMLPRVHQPIRPSADIEGVVEEDESTNDDQTLADLKMKRGAGTSQGTQILPVVDPSPILQRSLGRPRGSIKPSSLRTMMTTTSSAGTSTS